MDIFLTVIEVIGTIAFASSGAVTAIKKDMDAFGVIMLGVITAVGGGVMRDIILGSLPPAAFAKPLYTALAAASSALFFFPLIRNNLLSGKKSFEQTLFWMDSLGLGAFTVTGIIISRNLWEGGFFLPIALGLMTATGGGVLRDVLARDTPCIFLKEIYACASLAGAAFYFLLLGFFGEEISGITAITIVVLIRYLSRKYHWNLPTFRKKAQEN